ncbi:hypothetical protein [Brachybacterium sp. YJGR34]|uniref:hypothetical protein n=1 Tax=Brachybacterium sp. YJGR34 TaxID=2059911 RepID=UPI000E0B6BA5|nr:hypothetical protein [Brachybacterium sp. YJGR34]
MEVIGVRHRRQISAEGIAPAEVARWCRSGALRSVQPWYVTPEAPAALVDLLELGVRPTCIDGAAFHGLWTPIHSGVHVFRPRADRRAAVLDTVRIPALRRQGEELVRRGPHEPLVLHRPVLDAWPDDDPVPPLDLVLKHAARCLPTVKTAILLESAVHRGRLSLTAARDLVDGLPSRLRRPLSRIRADAESGTETAVRWWLEERRIPVRAQVPFLDAHGAARRVDLLVGRSWVIECDSRAFHDDPESYAADRDRDLLLRSRGYTVTRLTWEQVFLTWTVTRTLLRAVLDRGDHRRPVESRAEA